MPIKVLRLIEYTYDSPERMADDMLRWTMSRKHKGFEMRSAVLQPEWVVDDEAEEARRENIQYRCSSCGQPEHKGPCEMPESAE